MVKSEGYFSTVFTTSQPTTGFLSDADSLPTCTLYVNGVADVTVVTVAHLSTGVYSASLTFPVMNPGDIVTLLAEATVSSIQGASHIFVDTVDTKLYSELYSIIHGADNVPAYTYNVSFNGSPVDAAHVWVATDSAHTNVIHSTYTDANGNAVFYLTPGTYYFFQRKSGINFINPVQVVIT